VTNKHITEKVRNFAIGNNLVSTFSNNSVEYNVAINSKPFFLANTDERPYRRVTAKYRKDQVDQTTEPGEQTLTGWWLRSQSSFHLGAGIKFFEPGQDETLRYRFTESKGIDVWTQGEVSLLNNTVRGRSTASTNLLVVGARDNTNDVDAVVFTEGIDLKKLTMATDTPTVTTYTLTAAPHTLDFMALTSDGTRYFAADNDKLHRGNIFGSTSDGHIYDLDGPVGTVVLRYVKQRLIAGIDRDLYELDSNKATTAGGHALPTEHYVHPNPSWKWSAIAEGPVAFYAAGYAGSQSSIFKITLDESTDNALGFPTLNVPTVIADFPEGEIVQAFDIYLGTYAVICTNKGVRIGVLGDNGDLSYGPLLFEGDIKGISFRDRFAYVSGLVDGEAGLIRIDLSTPIGNTLRFPFAWDLVAAGETASATGVTFLGDTDRAVFAVPGDGVWVETATVKVTSGYLTTGRIRYNTLEPKVYKLIRPRIDLTYGSLVVDSVAADGTEYNINTFSEGSFAGESTTPYPTGAQEYVSFKFTLGRSAGTTSSGPVMTGYQIKALPATPKQRLIQFPLYCFDQETDSLGNQVGYEGRAYDRILELEAVENTGDTVTVQDFRTGETFIAQVEEVDFMNMTPPGDRFNGFGGLLTVTVRTV
jgi:hypothetical protein